MAVLNIHLEGIEKQFFRNQDVQLRLFELLNRDIPAVLSLPPWMEDYWKKTNPGVIDLARVVVKSPGSFLGQQGEFHQCGNAHTIADPWHENYCFYGKGLSHSEQRFFMERGRDRLEKLMGIRPVMYVPPNHQFDQTTLEVAEDMGYRYFADLALLPVKPYYFGSMLVVPEAPIRKGMFSFGNYIHYDEIDRNGANYQKALEIATPLSLLGGRESPDPLWAANRAIKTSYKVVRDVKRLLTGAR